LIAQLTIIRLYKIINIIFYFNFKFYLIFFKYLISPSFEHKKILKEIIDVNTYLDVGANRGQFILLLDYFFPSCKIIAFEPLKKEYHLLKKIFKKNANIKILNYMGLDYNIISNCTDSNYIVAKKLYKEETNAFAYYIIVSIILSNFNNFILWCIDNNTNIFQFDKSKNGITNFVKFIYKNYKSNELLNIIVDLEIRLETIDSRNADKQEGQKSNEMLRTMRMTIVGGYL
jgi:hypothetical protein